MRRPPSAGPGRGLQGGAIRSGSDLSAREREDLRLGRQRLARGDPDRALEHFERLLATRDDFADVHYMAGLAHDQKGDLDAASRSFERALVINPGYLEARVALSTVCERRGDFDRARSLATQAVAYARPSSDPIDATTRGKLANLQAALGDAYREVGDLREAVDAYRKALDRCPTFHDIRHRLAMTLRDAGLPNQAIQELRRVLRENPRHLASMVQLGVTYYTLGRSDEATRVWEQVLALEPGRGDAAMYLRMVRRGDRPAG